MSREQGKHNVAMLVNNNINNVKANNTQQTTMPPKPMAPKPTPRVQCKVFSSRIVLHHSPFTLHLHPPIAASPLFSIRHHG